MRATGENGVSIDHFSPIKELRCRKWSNSDNVRGEVRRNGASGAGKSPRPAFLRGHAIPCWVIRKGRCPASICIADGVTESIHNASANAIEHNLP